MFAISYVSSLQTNKNASRHILSKCTAKGWFIRRAPATPNTIISIKFGSGAMQARRIKPIFQLSSATAARSTDFAGRLTLARLLI